MKITVMGAGYVGMIAAACISKAGHFTVCIDRDKSKINRLKKGELPLHEEGLNNIVHEAMTGGYLDFANDFTQEHRPDIVVIAVGTPSLPDGRVDLSQVYGAIQTIVEQAEQPMIVVMKSTVPPGIGIKIKEQYLKKARVPLSYVSNPEFLREGQAVWDWYHPDRIVVGGDDREAIDKVLELYAEIDAPKVIMDITSAEMVKYTSNAFLATKISFINEIANLCELVGADILPVAEAVGMDNRIGPQFLGAGLGYGGSCFPKDTRGLDFLSTVNGHTFNLLKSVIEVNMRQRILAVRKLSKALGGLYGRQVGILGVAFKPNTDDTRESPALDIINMLLDEGAKVKAYDPVVKNLSKITVGKDVLLTDDSFDVIKDSHALVLCTDWPQIINIDWIKAIKLMKEPKVVLDGRNCLSKSLLVEIGYKYLSIGR